MRTDVPLLGRLWASFGDFTWNNGICVREIRFLREIEKITEPVSVDKLAFSEGVSHDYRQTGILCKWAELYD